MPPSSSLSLRDIASTVDGVRQTYSSWDSCMSKTYCKWPVIIGIIVASLIVLSILFCVFRCLCCGMQCCCGCLSCFNACCPSPRRQGTGRQQQAPPPPYPTAYAPVYPQPYQGMQTASFDVYNKPGGGKYNEDALPHMPSWDNASKKHIPEDDGDITEMDRLDPTADPHQRLLTENSPYQPPPNRPFQQMHYNSPYVSSPYSASDRHAQAPWPEQQHQHMTPTGYQGHLQPVQGPWRDV